MRNNKHYLLLVLLGVSSLNFLDHQILALLLQPIKEDMLLSDTQLGLLSGLAFAVFYCVLGIPVARWADRGNRINIVALSVTTFGGMTALFGTATNFFQLFLYRVGVGIGEAGCTPPSHSLIAEQFKPAERPQAMAIYMMGAPLGMVMGFFLAGWINDLYGWRIAFIVLGLPGVALGLLVKLTLRDPRYSTSLKNKRADISEERNAVETIDSIFTVISVLWRNTSYRYLLYTLSMTYFLGYGISQWMPTFFMREYGYQSSDLGMILSLIAIFGVMSTWLGGYLFTRFLPNRESTQLRVIAILNILSVMFNACVYLSGSGQLALVFLGLANALGYMQLGPVYAVFIGLAHKRMRAMAVAFLYLVINFIGMGLGPFAIGFISDFSVTEYGDDSLKIAILSVMPLALIASYFTWKASYTVHSDLWREDTELEENNELKEAAEHS